MSSLRLVKLFSVLDGAQLRHHDQNENVDQQNNCVAFKSAPDLQDRVHEREHPDFRADKADLESAEVKVPPVCGTSNDRSHKQMS